jgi:hypothetical protein
VRAGRKEYLTRREKVVDFLIGFFGWFILNAILSGATYLIGLALDMSGQVFNAPDLTELFQSAAGILGLVLLCAPLIINLALLIRFAFTRYWIAIGAASAFAAVLLLTICAGIVWTVACFVLLSGSGL